MTIATSTETPAAQASIHVDFDELLADPNAAFRKYRPLTPVIHNGAYYFVIRAADVLPLQKDKRLMQVESAMMKHRGFPTEGHMWRFLQANLLMSNGAVHVRRRGPAVDAFSRRMIAVLRDYIKGEARRLAAALPRGEEFDFIEHFCGPLTGRVIAQTVGLDPAQWREFASLVYTMTKGMAPPFPEDAWPKIDEAAGRFVGFVEEAVAERRARPRDDFLSAYIAAADAGEMDPEEVLMTLVSIVMAGSDTTRAGIAVTMGQLLEDRSRWEEVRSDRALVPAAVAECLRLEPPVGGSPRMTVEDLDVGGVTIPAGMPVDLLSISAMRDPALYARPDEFDLHRADAPRFHPIFGGGVHRCLGEQLALAELHEALDAMLDLAPGMRLVGPRPPLRGFTAVREAAPLIVRID